MIEKQTASIGYIISTERKGGYGSGIVGHLPTNGSSSECIARVIVKPPKNYKRELEAIENKDA
jgi:hypothetical protein